MPNLHDNRTVIVYGPAACGKTRNAERLRAHFDMERVVEEGCGFKPIGDLVLLSFRPPIHCFREYRVFTFAAACQMAGIDLPQEF
jgi:hypothetical protein